VSDGLMWPEDLKKLLNRLASKPQRFQQSTLAKVNKTDLPCAGCGVRLPVNFE